MLHPSQSCCIFNKSGAYFKQSSVKSNDIFANDMIWEFLDVNKFKSVNLLHFSHDFVPDSMPSVVHIVSTTERMISILTIS